MTGKIKLIQRYFHSKFCSVFKVLTVFLKTCLGFLCAALEGVPQFASSGVGGYKNGSASLSGMLLTETEARNMARRFEGEA